MDSVDLLARENEFKKLNKQLEKKTERLMKEIEEVMQKPDMFSAPKIKLNLSDASTPTRKHHCNSSNSTPISNNCAGLKPRNSHQRNNEKSTQNQNTLTAKDAVMNTKITSNCATSMECLHGPSPQNCEATCDAPSPKRIVCECCVKERVGDDMEFLYAFVSVNVQDKVLPQTFLKGNITVESVCKCLSAKIKLMQEQLDRLQVTIDNKNKQCEAHLARIAELEGERLSQLGAANAMRGQVADMRAKYAAIQTTLSEKDRMYTEQRSLADQLGAVVKQQRSKLTGVEARAAAHEEAAATLRQQLAVARLAEQEYRNSTRELSASHEAAVRRLEARAAALRARCGRQAALVGNLRAQRALLAGRRHVAALGERYAELLEAQE